MRVWMLFPNIYTEGAEAKEKEKKTRPSERENDDDYVFCVLVKLLLLLLLFLSFSLFDNIWVMLEAKLSMLECLSHSSLSVRPSDDNR